MKKGVEKMILNSCYGNPHYLKRVADVFQKKHRALFLWGNLILSSTSENTADPATLFFSPHLSQKERP